MSLEITERRAVLASPLTIGSFVPLAAAAAIVLLIWQLAPGVLYPIRVALLVALRLDSFAHPVLLVGVLAAASAIWLLLLKAVTVEFDAATRQVTMCRTGLLGFRSSQVFPFGDVLSLGASRNVGILGLRAQVPLRFPMSFASYPEQEAALEKVRSLTGFPKQDLPGSHLQLEVDGQAATLTSAPVGRIAGPVLAAAVVSGCYLTEVHLISAVEGGWGSALGRALLILCCLFFGALGAFAFQQPEIRAEFNGGARSLTLQSRSFVRNSSEVISFDAISAVGLERCLSMQGVVNAVAWSSDGQRYALSSRCGARDHYDHLLAEVSAQTGLPKRDAG